MISMDYGDTAKLVFHCKHGPFVPDKINTRGMSAAEKFAANLEHLLSLDDVVTESPTVGSSGAEPELIRKVVDSATHKLYTLSARTVKNYVKTHGLKTPLTDAEAAEILYNVATSNLAALQQWRYRSDDGKLKRQHKSVRPWDKRGYKGIEVDEWMSNLAPFVSLPAEMQALLSDGKARPDYARARVLPFAMAFTEEAYTEAPSRKTYLKVLGLYGHGYPSFYRRATVALMQRVAKDVTGKRYNSEITPEERKQAWKLTTRYIKVLYHLSRAQAIS